MLKLASTARLQNIAAQHSGVALRTILNVTLDDIWLPFHFIKCFSIHGIVNFCKAYQPQLLCANKKGKF